MDWSAPASAGKCALSKWCVHELRKAIDHIRKLEEESNRAIDHIRKLEEDIRVLDAHIQGGGAQPQMQQHIQNLSAKLQSREETIKSLTQQIFSNEIALADTKNNHNLLINELRNRQRQIKNLENQLQECETQKTQMERAASRVRRTSGKSRWKIL